MDTLAARQEFDFRWTVLGGICLAAASASLLQLSLASATFAASVAIGLVVGGAIARRSLDEGEEVARFMLVQRWRMILVALIAPLAALFVSSDRTALMVVAGAALWLVSVSTFLQLGARYVPAQVGFLAYVQYIGDFWIALFLAVWGTDWLLVAAVLVISAPIAVSAGSAKEKRLLPVVVLSIAALFLFGVPTNARLFALYATAVISLSAWNTHHLMALASHMRGLTVSASDGSAPH